MQAFFKKIIRQRLKMPRAAYALAASALTVYVSIFFISFAMDTKYIGLDAGHTLAKADAIVVLTGGKGRISEGVALLRAGKGKVLIISGVAAEASADSIFRSKLTREELAGIILEKKSRSTFENAVEVRRLAEERGLKSVVLLTSIYHMKRASFIFRHVMPADVVIEPYFVTTPNFNENRWWGYNSIGLLAVEFVKYCWYDLKFALEAA